MRNIVFYKSLIFEVICPFWRVCKQICMSAHHCNMRPSKTTHNCYIVCKRRLRQNKNALRHGKLHAYLSKGEITRGTTFVRLPAFCRQTSLSVRGNVLHYFRNMRRFVQQAKQTTRCRPSCEILTIVRSLERQSRQSLLLSTDKSSAMLLTNITTTFF